jgi:hypothetical protein
MLVWLPLDRGVSGAISKRGYWVRQGVADIVGKVVMY